MVQANAKGPEKATQDIKTSDTNMTSEDRMTDPISMARESIGGKTCLLAK